MVGGTRIRERPDWNPNRETALETEVKESAYRIIARKGATNHAIGLVTANLLQGMLRNERRVLTVSRVQDGAFGLEDVALSLPAVVGSDGASVVLEPHLDQAERDGLVRSANVLSEAIETVSGV